MTVTIPPTIENEVKERAARLLITPDTLVAKAIHSYLCIDPELLEEIAAWEATSIESLLKFEESLAPNDVTTS